MFASSKFLFKSFFFRFFFGSFLRYFHSGWIGIVCACVLRVAKRAKNLPLYRKEYSNWHSPTHLWQMAWISTRGNELKFRSDFHQIGTNRKYSRVGADFLRGSWKTRKLGFFQRRVVPGTFTFNWQVQHLNFFSIFIRKNQGIRM